MNNIVLTVGSMILFALQIHAQQVVLQENTITWENQGRYPTFKNGNAKQCVQNWHDPVDWYNGSIYVKIEVLKKANDSVTTNLLFRILNAQHDMDKCMRFGVGKVLFKKTGVYYYTLKPREASPLVPNTTFNWHGPILRVQLVIADSIGQAVDIHAEQAEQQDICSTCRNFIGHPNMELYFPITIKFTYIAVAAGSVFIPPNDWY